MPSLHAAVAEVHRIVDPSRRAALLKLLRVEIDGALAETNTKSAADKEQRARDKAGGHDESRHKMHPVLRRLGNLGKFRLLWEYYNVYIEKRPTSTDKPAVFPCGPGTYMNELYEHMIGAIDDSERKSVSAMRYVCPICPLSGYQTTCSLVCRSLSVSLSLYLSLVCVCATVLQFCAITAIFFRQVVFVLNAYERTVLSFLWARDRLGCG